MPRQDTDREHDPWRGSFKSRMPATLNHQPATIDNRTRHRESRCHVMTQSPDDPQTYAAMDNTTYSQRSTSTRACRHSTLPRHRRDSGPPLSDDRQLNSPLPSRFTMPRHDLESDDP
ncbi:hypothetical protein D9619_011184 [Psilocybe cf. subviscida]|uniref:Uncharacterized protein n=1 Tax=Psilocybe cf. subviscida TaxID=2480587 RepID=A0A8H5BJA0_9AGAR|nr:hypothetical protein D9619_011184 [Psilocybe cf. subviscida]